MGGCRVQMLASSSPRLAPMVMMVIASLLLLGAAEAAVDCATVRALVSTCSAFIAYGTPDPYPGTPCCDAMTTLNMVAEPLEDRRAVCSCLMGLINAYSPNATAIATLAGFCGVSLGFSISPNTDCNYI
ncbi:hypothetical protein EUGRSUZ_K00232 [Eucalyptus grandis]|uniref:Uncharacterized protein n=2 Tax=Eucalyptus grandis TaxID=71139 RepID=A0ACC3IPL2_EUCGR|nr:hypothetical protein EUGRSUZ_K00232 [Eucalyptus grandis]